MLDIHQHKPLEWLTIREAVNFLNKQKNVKIKDGDIYRHALHGKIFLSIYFQSPVILRRIQIIDHKVTLKPIGSSLLNRLCLLDKNCFISGRNLIISTKGESVYPSLRGIDTTLSDYDYDSGLKALLNNGDFFLNTAPSALLWT